MLPYVRVMARVKAGLINIKCTTQDRSQLRGKQCKCVCNLHTLNTNVEHVHIKSYILSYLGASNPPEPLFERQLEEHPYDLHEVQRFYSEVFNSIHDELVYTIIKIGSVPKYINKPNVPRPTVLCGLSRVQSLCPLCITLMALLKSVSSKPCQHATTTQLNTPSTSFHVNSQPLIYVHTPSIAFMFTFILYAPISIHAPCISATSQ